jgi:hypothetical protein
MCQMINKVYMTCYPTHCTPLSYLTLCPKYTYEASWYCDTNNKCALSRGYSNF